MRATSILLCMLLGSPSLAQQAEPATEPAPEPAPETMPRDPSPEPARENKPPPPPKAFKPSEEVMADTILTLPADI